MSRRLAGRVGRIEASGIRRIFDLARRVRDPVDLSIGQPDFDVPEALRERAVAAIRAGRNRYTPTQGLAALQEAVRRHLARTRGGWQPEEVLITAGASGALCLAFLALLEAGDEILVPDPYFVSYKHLARLAGAEPVFVATYPDFRLEAARLRAALTPRTRALILNSPANPTGALLSRAEVEGALAVAREADLAVIADEVYEDFAYDAPFASAAPLAPDALLVGGLSKRAAMTGWRIGFAAGPGELISALAKLQQYTFVCAPAPFQEAAAAAFAAELAPPLAAYRRKRDLVYEGLREKYKPVKPGGAFYLFAPAPHGLTGSAFAEEALQRRLLIIPGGAFSERDTHFRLSFAAPDETLARGVEILNGLA